MCWLGLLAACIANIQGATFTNHIANMAFLPNAQTINMGDTVVWKNDDNTSHTTTSGSPGAPSGLWSSGLLAPGQSFSRVFNSAGSFSYYCEVHSFMTGTITVLAGNGTPTVAITQPTNNAIFTNGSISLAATASVTGSTITQVEFFDGSNSLGIDMTTPYSITANLAAGSHSLTAKATAGNGSSAISAGVNVTVTLGTGGMRITNAIPEKIQKSSITIDLQPFADGFVSPLGMAAPDDGTGRLFVYDQTGVVQIVSSNGVKMAGNLLDVRARMVTLNTNYDERGLIGLATHPNFAQKPFIYTYTSEPNGPMADFMIMTGAGETNNCQSVIAEWKIDANDPNKVDPASRREILRMDKPQSNHNGGTIRFGPDGFLYFTIGDGGEADDQGQGHSPGGNAQDKTKILGKIVRINVDARTSSNGKYGIPQDNPFVGQAGVVQEIFAYGLRNPYTFSFDKQTGDILLADVGQNDVEEVDKIVKGGNFGWPIKEGSFFFDPNGTNNGFVTTVPVRVVPADLIDPIAQFDHDEGAAIVGGYVYRGGAISNLVGKYLCASWGDFATSDGRLFVMEGSQLKELRIGVDDHGLGMWVKGFGEDRNGEVYVFGSIDLGPTGTSGVMLKLAPAGTAPHSSNSYRLSNLVSDLPNIAANTDTNLANPWGLAFGPTTPFWIADNHAGISTIYDSTGAVQSLVVTIPPASGGTPPGAPTGMVFNDTTNFVVGSTPARFIFATEDGTISAWNAGTNAILKAEHTNTIYKGLELATNGGNAFLFAADFHGGKIDVFDSNFQPVTIPGGFVDAGVPAGFAPFNVRKIGGSLYVTYAKQDDEMEDDVPGAGNGYINVFDTAGKKIKRFASGGNLNSPWGIALAPANFGAFGGALLVGNFGDGRINAFDATSGALLGQLKNPNGIPLWVDGLWDLKFGNGTKAGDANKLYFTAGISREAHGLFGVIAASEFAITVTRNANTLTLRWSGGVGPFTVQKKVNLNDATWTDVKTQLESSIDLTLDSDHAFFRIRQATP